MCNNIRRNENKKYEELGRLAAELLKGTELAEIAVILERSEEKVLEMIEEIKPINPYLYKQVKEKMKVS